jgi:flagellar basal-body rod protein FlgF
MDNAQLISLSRQIGLQRQMDVVANNLANINTTGFKAESILFEAYDMPVARERQFALLDQPLAFSQDWATMHDLTPGAVVETGNPLDVALVGQGFLAVETPQGERWSRGGSMQVDAQGQLVDASGNPVLSDVGPIRFEPNETEIAISDDGAISTQNGIKGRLRVVEFANVQELSREGSSLWGGGQPVPASETRVRQGAIERANVSGIAEMSEMIRVQRSYQSLASLMQRQDELRRSAIQRLGDLSA